MIEFVAILKHVNIANEFARIYIAEIDVDAAARAAVAAVESDDEYNDYFVIAVAQKDYADDAAAKLLDLLP